MKAGIFDIHSYLNKLNEEAEMKEKQTTKVDSLGLIIPEENVKVYNWLKSEYQKGKTEVKVEMNIGGSKFEPGYDMQGHNKNVDSFKPGMYGAVKTSDNSDEQKNVKTGENTGEKPAQKTEEKKTDNSAEKKEEKKTSIKGGSVNLDLKTKKNDK